MKRKITNVLFGLVFLVGFGILAYPTVSDQWNKYRQNKLISNYESAVGDMAPEDFTKEWEKARAFNETLTKNNIYGDVFGGSEEDLKDTEYWNVLNVAGDGIMGYMSIPKINLKLAVYHGTAEEVLQTGIGHLNGTKLPIGGESTHSVVAAHRGLPSAKLFTDADKLVEGDEFYIHVLDETLAYKVDKIYPMIDKDDQEALSEALQIEQGQDYMTLFTCTPYGVNSHRLLVRGTRIPYTGDAEENGNPVVKAVRNYYMFFLIAGLVITIVIILTMNALSKKKGNPPRGPKGSRGSKGAKSAKDSGASKGTRPAKGSRASKGARSTKGSGASKGAGSARGSGASTGTKPVKSTGASKGAKSVQSSGVSKGAKPAQSSGVSRSSGEGKKRPGDRPVKKAPISKDPAREEKPPQKEH